MGMNASACFNLFAVVVIACSAAFLSGAMGAPASGNTASPVPARGHYAKLGTLEAGPAAANLPIDAQRFPTAASFIEKVEVMEPEFVRVPLDTFKLPPCPANSSKQTRAEIDYLLHLQAHRTNEEGERALYFASWGYSSTLKRDNPDFEPQQRNLFYVGRSIGSWFNPKDLPVTAELLGRVWRDASHYMWRLKFKNARIRPYTIRSLDEESRFA